MLPSTTDPCVEISGIWDASLAAAGLRYGGLTPVVWKVVKFVDWKRSGSLDRCPFSADKKSGIRGNGTVFQKYIQLNLHHCHLDLVGTDPMVAYRVFNNGTRILLLCITDHQEMFASNRAENAFHAKIKTLVRSTLFPK